ncbi:MAG TPA: hypothetical protein PL105_02780, partial [Caldilineaceae bacterium]|nr:hypothetical protein [Caldilineaceae bacterium]
MSTGIPNNRRRIFYGWPWGWITPTNTKAPVQPWQVTALSWKSTLNQCPEIKAADVISIGGQRHRAQ